MKVKLVSYTQVAKDFFSESMLKTAEDLVTFCARVSNPSNQYNTQTSAKLIGYLLKHKHFSPFEMVNVCLEIETTRDIARQILRHRSFTFQEFSQRYADPTKDLSFELREARLQDPKNRQNSLNSTNEVLQAVWLEKQQSVVNLAKEVYEWGVKHEIAKEVARAVLPEGLTMSRMYVNGTLRSWLHYIEVRASEGTQKEHMLIARECATVIAKVFPTVEQFITRG